MDYKIFCFVVHLLCLALYSDIICVCTLSLHQKEMKFPQWSNKSHACEGVVPGCFIGTWFGSQLHECICSLPAVTKL